MVLHWAIGIIPVLNCQSVPARVSLLKIGVDTRVRMRRDFLYRLIEKYFEQLIDSVLVIQPHCCNFKANDFEHYCAAIDESVHQI